MSTALPDVETMIDDMAGQLQAVLAERRRSAPLIIGIRTGGVWLAQRLHQRLGLGEPLGMLNINFYRDDFTRIGMHPRVEPSALPFAVDDRDIVLVDDVLHTGRTVRAALNEVFDYGRPASVMLAVLVERDGREIPIQADVIGITLTLSGSESVKLTGPEPLRLELRREG
jgi:pyrimidine operon attenuation protein/uracil phosphoribosyltransferase